MNSSLEYRSSRGTKSSGGKSKEYFRAFYTAKGSGKARLGCIANEFVLAMSTKSMPARTPHASMLANLHTIV
jgi:hypothetical protein